jgi:putative ABC transport system permease protein
MVLAGFAHELRFALRRLMQAPGFSLAVVLMLSLGIAVSTVTIGVLRGVLGSLPFPDPERVVAVEGYSAGTGIAQGNLTPLEAVRLAQSDVPFAHFGYYTWNDTTVLDGGRARGITTFVVSEGLFAVLGRAPLLGNGFVPEDFERGDAVMLSHREWQRLFGGDPSVIGRYLETAEGQLRVAGVMPADFDFPSGAWRPMPRDAFQLERRWTWQSRSVSAVARLDPAVSAAALAQRLDAFSASLAEEIGHQGQHLGQWQLRPRPLLDTVVGDVRGTLWGTFAVSLLVLLIACANTAILIDARQTARRHEQAVAQALGASRARLVRGQMLELGVLTALAVILGVMLAMFGIDALRELARSSLPRVNAIAIDAKTLAIAAGMAALAPLLALLTGALRPRGEASEAMRSGGKGLVAAGSRRKWLPVLGVALSTTSLVVGSAFLLSLWRLQAVDPGLRHENVYALQMFHDGGPEQRLEFARRLGEELQALPGVESVGLGSSAPLVSQIGNMRRAPMLPGRDEPEAWMMSVRRVWPQYAPTLRIPIVQGRNIDDTDRYGSERTAVINREAARRLFGETDPINRTVEISVLDSPRVPYRIVGISENVRNNNLRAPPEPEMWASFASEVTNAMTFIVAARQPLANYENLLADALNRVEPGKAASLITSMDEQMGEQLAPSRFFARTVGAFAVAALLLAAFGVYAVAALRQKQRTAELGLRLAIGASPGALAIQVLGDSARSAATA